MKQNFNNTETGLFNLEEFIGYPIDVVNKYFKDKCWITIDCFNDYKLVWANHLINKSIVAKSQMIDDINLGYEIVVNIWWFEGIYSGI